MYCFEVQIYGMVEVGNEADKREYDKWIASMSKARYIRKIYKTGNIRNRRVNIP